MTRKPSLLDRVASFAWTPKASRREINPFYRQLWGELARSVEKGVILLREDVQSVPNLVEVYINALDYDELVAPYADDVFAAAEKELDQLRKRLAFPPEAVVIYRFIVAEPEQLDVSRGQPLVRARKVKNPWRVDAAWKDGLRMTTQWGPPTPAPPPPLDARPLPGSPHGQSASPPNAGPATAPSKQYTPLAVLRWQDAAGGHEKAIYGPSILGRKVPGESAELQVDPGPVESGSDLWALSRQALRIESGQTDGRVHLTNLGRWPIRAVTQHAEVEIAPGGTLPVSVQVVLVWLGAQGGDGFRLMVEAPRDGVAVLDQGGVSQRFCLRAPETIVTLNLTDGTTFQARLDLSTRPSGFLMLEPLSSHTLRHNQMTYTKGRPGQVPVSTGVTLDGGNITLSIHLDQP